VSVRLAKKVRNCVRKLHNFADWHRVVVTFRRWFYYKSLNFQGCSASPDLGCVRLTMNRLNIRLWGEHWQTGWLVWANFLLLGDDYFEQVHICEKYISDNSYWWLLFPQ
jgi:hypothetical protein